MSIVEWQPDHKTPQEQWSGRVVGPVDRRQAEMRRMINGPTSTTEVLVIVSLGNGYTHGYHQAADTRGINVHIASKHEMQLTFDDLSELHSAVDEAAIVLQNLYDREIV